MDWPIENGSMTAAANSSYDFPFTCCSLLFLGAWIRMVGHFFQNFFGGVSMRRVLLFGLAVFAFCVLLSTAALAGNHNPADFPLRVHIFTHNSVSHYWGPGGARSLNDVDGEGRANLFENGEAHGFDFRYNCGSRLMNSAGYETYVARWKKPGMTLELLLPARAGTCDLQVDVKPDVVYIRHKGSLLEEPVARYKAWMIKHQYDPEHGKNLPMEANSEPASTQTPAGTGATAPR